MPRWIGSSDAQAETVLLAEAALPPPPPPETAEEIFARGEAAFALGRWTDASAAYRAATGVRADFARPTRAGRARY